MTKALAVKDTVWGQAIIQTKNAFVQITDTETFEKECRFALQAFQKNTTLQSCPLQTIQDAIMNIALTGATLNPIKKQAYLIPRSVKGVMICCLDFDYRGLIRLATKDGSVIDMDADVVYDGDEFYYERGLAPILEHIPNINRKKAEITHVYATALLPNGIKKFIVLNRVDIDKVRNASVASNSPMWKDWYEEGARKTAIKKLYKMLPQTDQMSQAVKVLNDHEGVDFVAREKEIKRANASEIEDTFGNAEPQTSDTDKITDATITKIQTMFSKCLIKSSGDRHRAISEMIKRKIKTTKELTRLEADIVIEELDKLMAKTGEVIPDPLEETEDEIAPEQLLMEAETLADLSQIWKTVNANRDDFKPDVYKGLVKIKEDRKKTLTVKKPDSVIEKCAKCKEKEDCMMTPEQRKMCEGK